MLQRHPKPSFIKFLKRGAAILFVVEATLFAGSYALWYRLNTNRDFRLYMFKNFPRTLDGYYQIGETLSSDTAPRNRDLSIWKQEGKI